MIVKQIPVFISLLIISCTRSEKGVESINITNAGSTSLSPKDYVNWVKDNKNGLKKDKKIEDLIFTVQYKPIDYVICMEERSDEIADSTIKKKTKELEGMEYIDFKIEVASGQGELLKHNLSDRAEYKDRVNYFAYKMQQDIQLVEGLDTIPCSLSHFERAYDVAPYSSFVLGFASNPSYKGNKTFVYHDQIFKKGIIQFEFQEKDFQSIPKLETNEK